jgi:hypothetical protein
MLLNSSPLEPATHMQRMKFPTGCITADVHEAFIFWKTHVA